jgi:hypothetical protein
MEMITPDLTEVVNSFISRDLVSLNYTGCSGTCQGTVVAPGFDVNCTPGTIPYNISFNHTNGEGQEWIVGSADVSFGGNQSSSYDTIVVSTVFKSNAGETGNLSTTSSELHLAKVQYLVIISNSTVALAPHQFQTNGTLELVYIPDELRSLAVYPSSIGGIAVAAQGLYQSSLTLVSAVTGYRVQSSGPLGPNYRNPSQVGSAEMTWTDPAPDIVSAIREITFRAAIASSNASTAAASQCYRDEIGDILRIALRVFSWSFDCYGFWCACSGSTVFGFLGAGP